MKKFLITMALGLSFFIPRASAIDLSKILGNAGSAVQGVVEGIFTQTDITVEQMTGTWTATGSAVSFSSENALKKAGGNAIAATIESKLDPYYKQYGLTGSTLTVNSDGSFVLKVKNISLKGTISKRSDGNFDFKFTPFGNFSLGSIRAYVEKPVNGLNVMFDASKLKSLLTAAANFTGNSLATTAAGLLESYDGLLVGFSYTGQGSSNVNSGTSGSGASGSDIINKASEALKGLLGK